MSQGPMTRLEPSSKTSPYRDQDLQLLCCRTRTIRATSQKYLKTGLAMAASPIAMPQKKYHFQSVDRSAKTPVTIAARQRNEKRVSGISRILL